MTGHAVTSADFSTSSPAIAAALALQTTTPHASTAQPAINERSVAHDAIQVSQLLTSRICHDLVGPVGIAAASDDLRDVDGRLDDEALQLVSDSARVAANRLAFFRFAFGFGHGQATTATMGSLAPLAENALADHRIRIDWLASDDGRHMAERGIPAQAARLILCLTLLACEALPRGGRISVEPVDGYSGFTVLLRAEGRGARFPLPSLDAFRATRCDGLTPRTIVGFVAGQLSRELGARLDCSENGEGGVTLALHFAAASGEIIAT
ncbi:MAG: hypothetical protein HC826_01400 [Rhodospirillales bacterium]|nr:hypothetical protein [Rhodospirillales bacterium]